VKSSNALELSAEAFSRWYEVAGVRSGVRRTFHAEMEQGMVFFPAALVPYLAHPLVQVLSPDAWRELTLRHLYQFLASTTHIETRVVNRGAEAIANDRMALGFDASVRLAAFKVYCDEGYHALYSLDLADQIASVTEVPIPEADYGGLVARLEASAQRLLPDLPDLAQLLQVIVFETLITAVLKDIPSDPTVVSAVRELMRDHARDEGRHHRFFAALFPELWMRLSAELRERVARTLPRLIRDCLSWDTAPVKASLRAAGLGAEAAEQVVRDCYQDDLRRIREITRATVAMCESAEVLAVPGAREAFAEQGLYAGEAGPMAQSAHG
jgi:hypothetical protein